MLVQHVICVAYTRMGTPVDQESLGHMFCSVKPASDLEQGVQGREVIIKPEWHQQPAADQRKQFIS